MYNPHYTDHAAPTGITMPDHRPPPKSKFERKLHGHLLAAKKLATEDHFPRIYIEVNDDNVSFIHEDSHLTICRQGDRPGYANLRKLVYQCVLRVVHNLPTQEGCPLMSPYDLAITDKQADKLFAKLARKCRWEN